MTIILSSSPELQTCEMCLKLGMPPEGITPKEPFLIMAHEARTFHCCMDCFQRLYDEVEHLAS